jgi:hypothetical protein
MGSWKAHVRHGAMLGVSGALVACMWSRGTDVEVESRIDVSGAAEALCELLSPCCVWRPKSSWTTWCRGLIDLAVIPSEYSAEAAEECLAQLHGRPFAERCAEFRRGACSVFYGGGQHRARRSQALGELCREREHCAPSPLGPVACIWTEVGEEEDWDSRCLVTAEGAEGDGPCQTVSELGSDFSTVRSVDSQRVFSCRSERGLFCHEATETCVRVAALGEPCEWSGCGRHRACRLVSDEDERRCVEAIPFGAACSESGPPCEDATTCTNGVCALTVSYSSLLCGP